MNPIATSAGEIDDLLTWLRDEIKRTAFGEVGLSFRLHEGKVVGITRTVSCKGRFELHMLGENGD